MNILRLIMQSLDEDAAHLAGLHNLMQTFDANDTARHCAVMAALTEIQQKVNIMSDAQASLDTTIATLIADNVTLKGAVDSAPAAIATLIAAVVAKQVGLGVTPAQLQSLADLHEALKGEAAQLQGSLAGNAPPPPAVVTLPALPVLGAVDLNTELPVTPPLAPPPV